MRASAQRFTQKVIGEAGLRFLSTIFVLFLARRLGAEDFGRYSTAMAYAALCIVFVDLGTNSILTREIARHPEKRKHIADSSHFLKMAAAIGSWLILLGVTYGLKFSPDQRYVTLCLGIVVIGYTLTEYFSALLSGIEEMGWEAALKVFSRILGYALGFLALARHQPLHTIVTSMALGTIAGYVVCVWMIKNRYGSFGMTLDIPFLKELFASCLPLFGSVIFWILYDSQDILLLNYFHFPQRDIGWFSAAMKIMDVVRVYPVLMLGVFFPTLSKLHLSDPAGFERKRQRLMLFMAGSSIGIAAAVSLLAPWLVRLLYKGDFMPAAHLLRLLSPTLVVMALNHTQMQLLIALNQERKLLTGSFIVCVINLLIACAMLPAYGTAGACYALFASEIAYWLFLRQTLKTGPPNS